jgi:hypothetical protein
VGRKALAQADAALARAELDRAMAGDLDRQRVIEQRAAVQARLNGARGSAAAAVRQADQAHAAAVSRAATTKQDLQRGIAIGVAFVAADTLLGLNLAAFIRDVFTHFPAG